MTTIRTHPFADENSSDVNADPFEQAIAADLWRWAFLPPHDAARHEILASSSLAMNLEWYLCGVFREVELQKSRGWWCDGVEELSVTKMTRTSFRIVGALWPGESYLAPFELEFHFPKRRDLVPTSYAFAVE